MSDLEKLMKRREEEAEMRRQYPEFFGKPGEDDDDSLEDEDLDEQAEDNDDGTVLKDMFASYTQEDKPQTFDKGEVTILRRDIATLQAQIRKTAHDDPHIEVLKTALEEKKAEVVKLKETKKAAAQQRNPASAQPILSRKKIVTVPIENRGEIEWKTQKYTLLLQKIIKQMRKDKLNLVCLIGNTVDRYVIDSTSSHNPANNFRPVYPILGNQRSRGGSGSGTGYNARNRYPNFNQLPPRIKTKIAELIVDLKVHFPSFEDEEDRMTE